MLFMESKMRALYNHWQIWGSFIYDPHTFLNILHFWLKDSAAKSSYLKFVPENMIACSRDCIENLKVETHQNARPLGSIMAEQHCFGCLDSWPCNCKQTSSLRFPIHSANCEYIIKFVLLLPNCKGLFKRKYEWRPV